MIYFLSILICLTAGFFFIRLLTNGRLNLILHLLLALVLGFGLIGTTAFYAHILFNEPNRWLPVGFVLIGVLILFFSYSEPKGQRISTLMRSFASLRMTKNNSIGLLTLIVLAIPLIISANHYPLGGWDAWSCWNLKAKFIFLGAENWKDMLKPSLWQSNTHYPLLWPLMNVWFWDLGGHFDQSIPMINSIIFALLTAGILLFGILELTGQLWVSCLCAVLVTALPLGVTLYTSQYSDALLGLFLLSAFMSFLLAQKYKLPGLKILCMIFLGLMAFTKNEGLIAAGITALLIFWHQRADKKELKNLIPAFFIALLPAIIFTLFIAPKNEAFTNGFFSSEKPTSLARLSIILAYPFFEFISSKWNCFWILALGGILLAGKKLWQSTLGVMGFSLILYLAVVLLYYDINTFFEISWWLSTTLSRILFALIPSISLWIALALLA